MNCPICAHRPVSGKNKTCGNSKCKLAMTRRTQEGNALLKELHYRKAAYRKDNPWVQWMEKEIRK